VTRVRRLAEVVSIRRRIRDPLQRVPHDGLKKDGRETAEAIGAALDEARLDRTAVDYVNTHGSGAEQNDRHETAALGRSFGVHVYDVPVSSIKSVVGHSLGAIGSVEIAACAPAIRTDVVPPMAGKDAGTPTA